MPEQKLKKPASNLSNESSYPHPETSPWAKEVNYDADNEYLEEIFKCIVFSGCDMPE